MWKFALAFTIIPLVELFLVLQVGSMMGPTSTFAMILITGVVGGWLAKREGLGVLNQLKEELGKGIPPGERLMEGVLVIVGGLLLITPGVLTDITGFLFIFPWTRRRIAPFALRWLLNKFDLKASLGPGRPVGTAAAAERPGATPFSTPFD